MNELIERHLISTSVENAEGTQVWWVDASSKEEAMAKFEAGEGEIYSNEVEVTKLGEPTHAGIVDMDDFGDEAKAESDTKKLIDQIQTLQAENERLNVALDCDRAILKARTDSMNRFMAERDALAAKLATLEADAERGRFMIKNGCWHRGEEQTHLSVLVPQGSDLSCVATRRDAVDAAIDAAKGGQHD